MRHDDRVDLVGLHAQAAQTVEHLPAVEHVVVDVADAGIE